MKIDHINHVFKRLIFLWFLFLLICTYISILTAYIHHNPWKIGDWLINCHGGFIRRCILGEAILIISHILNLNPGIYTAIIQACLYSLFFFIFIFNHK